MTKTNHLATKLAEISSEVKRVQLDAYNKEQKYGYVTAAAVLSRINDALSSRGIAISSDSSLEHFSLESRDGRAARAHAVVKLTLTFVDGETGERITVAGMGSGCDSGDKAVMKANTAALKYAYANAFTISWGDDPEADGSTDNEAKKTVTTKSTESVVDAKKLATTIKRAITKADSAQALDSIREKIIKARGELKALEAKSGGSVYDVLVSLFNEKKNELTPEVTSA